MATQGYVAGKGYVTSTGKIYPTTNPNFVPKEASSNTVIVGGQGYSVAPSLQKQFVAAKITTSSGGGGTSRASSSQSNPLQIPQTTNAITQAISPQVSSQQAQDQSRAMSIANVNRQREAIQRDANYVVYANSPPTPQSAIKIVDIRDEPTIEFRKNIPITETGNFMFVTQKEYAANQGKAASKFMLVPQGNNLFENIEEGSIAASLGQNIFKTNILGTIPYTQVQQAAARQKDIIRYTRASLASSREVIATEKAFMTNPEEFKGLTGFSSTTTTEGTTYNLEPSYFENLPSTKEMRSFFTDEGQFKFSKSDEVYLGKGPSILSTKNVNIRFSSFEEAKSRAASVYLGGVKFSSALVEGTVNYPFAFFTGYDENLRAISPQVNIPKVSQARRAPLGYGEVLGGLIPAVPTVAYAGLGISEAVSAYGAVGAFKQIAQGLSPIQYEQGIYTQGINQLTRTKIIEYRQPAGENIIESIRFSRAMDLERTGSITIGRTDISGTKPITNSYTFQQTPYIRIGPGELEQGTLSSGFTSKGFGKMTGEGKISFIDKYASRNLLGDKMLQGGITTGYIQPKFNVYESTQGIKTFDIFSKSDVFKISKFGGVFEQKGGVTLFTGGPRTAVRETVIGDNLLINRPTGAYKVTPTTTGKIYDLDFFKGSKDLGIGNINVGAGGGATKTILKQSFIEEQTILPVQTKQTIQSTQMPIAGFEFQQKQKPTVVQSQYYGTGQYERTSQQLVQLQVFKPVDFQKSLSASQIIAPAISQIQTPKIRGAYSFGSGSLVTTVPAQGQSLIPAQIQLPGLKQDYKTELINVGQRMEQNAGFGFEGFGFPAFLPGPFGLPMLGGSDMTIRRTRGRKTNEFNIAPSFSAIIGNIKMKSPIKVSKTFGVTPFQVRGLLKGKKSKGPYFKLVDF